MNRKEAEAFFERNRSPYAESGYFKIALRGPLDVLKKVQGREKPQVEKDGKDTPEGEQVILHIWKTLFPEAGIHIQRENGKCRYFDNEGGEYFLLCGDGTDTRDNGAFFDRYEQVFAEARPSADSAGSWGFPSSADWIPLEMFAYDNLFDEEGEEGEDW